MVSFPGKGPLCGTRRALRRVGATHRSYCFLPAHAAVAAAVWPALRVTSCTSHPQAQDARYCCTCPCLGFFLHLPGIATLVCRYRALFSDRALLALCHSPESLFHATCLRSVFQNGRSGRRTSLCERRGTGPADKLPHLPSISQTAAPKPSLHLCMPLNMASAQKPVSASPTFCRYERHDVALAPQLISFSMCIVLAHRRISVRDPQARVTMIFWAESILTNVSIAVCFQTSFLFALPPSVLTVLLCLSCPILFDLALRSLTRGSSGSDIFFLPCRRSRRHSVDAEAINQGPGFRSRLTRLHLSLRYGLRMSPLFCLRLAPLRSSQYIS